MADDLPRILAFLPMLTISLVVGCAPSSVQVKTGLDAVPLLTTVSTLTKDQRRQVADSNKRAAEWFRTHEWPLHRDAARRSEAPKQCLALSGGGIRSAAFSLGVMKALQEAGRWEKFDLVSAVSGGSYALS